MIIKNYISLRYSRAQSKSRIENRFYIESISQTRDHCKKMIIKNYIFTSISRAKTFVVFNSYGGILKGSSHISINNHFVQLTFSKNNFSTCY
jgi:hypothetical protein